MRTLETIPHPEFLISIMYFNEKFILRIETGPYEQVYKFTREMASSQDALKKYITPSFLTEVKENFNRMHQTLLSQFSKLQNS
jgi:hypothetical protein